jgi:hypothetical protein
MSKISGLKKGEIVRIKFKEMRDIVSMRSKNKSYALIGEWDLGSNVLAFTYGGDFLIKEDVTQAANKEEVLELINHLDGGTFDIPDEVVDTLEIIDAAAKFVSEEHNLILVMSENDLFINGEKLENNKEEKLLDNFVIFVEKYLMNRVVNASLKDIDDV